MTPFLVGKGFVLRKAEKQDIPSYFAYQQEDLVKKNFMSVPKNLKEAKKELFPKKSPDAFGFVIEVEGECVGSIGVHHIVKNHKASITYWLARHCRGRGIATACVKAVTAHAFQKYNLHRIEGYVRTFNKASARVLEKAGYKLEGILRKNKCRDGKFLDDMVWAKVR